MTRILHTVDFILIVWAVVVAQALYRTIAG
jgi:hypothetical protein